MVVVVFALSLASTSVCVPVSIFITLQQFGHMYLRVGEVVQEPPVEEDVLFFFDFIVTPIIGCEVEFVFVGVPVGVGYWVETWVFDVFFEVIVMELMFEEEDEVDGGVFRRNQSVLRDDVFWVEEFERFKSVREGES